MLRPSRTPPTELDMRWFYARVLMFVTGAGIGIAGMASGRELLVNIGIVILAIALIMRMISKFKERKSHPPDPSAPNP